MLNITYFCRKNTLEYKNIVRIILNEISQNIDPKFYYFIEGIDVLKSNNI